MLNLIVVTALLWVGLPLAVLALGLFLRKTMRKPPSFIGMPIDSDQERR